MWHMSQYDILSNNKRHINTAFPLLIIIEPWLMECMKTILVIAKWKYIHCCYFVNCNLSCLFAKIFIVTITIITIILLCWFMKLCNSSCFQEDGICTILCYVWSLLWKDNNYWLHLLQPLSKGNQCCYFILGPSL